VCGYDPPAIIARPVAPITLYLDQNYLSGIAKGKPAFRELAPVLRAAIDQQAVVVLESAIHELESKPRPDLNIMALLHDLSRGHKLDPHLDRAARDTKRRMIWIIEHELPERRPRPSDRADLDALAQALTHCDLVTTDAFMADVIKRARLDLRHRSELFSGRRRDVLRLIDRLRTLIAGHNQPRAHQPRRYTTMAENELHQTAEALVAEGKGILAADESTGTIKKRFDSINLESTEDRRRAYREMLFTTPGVEDYISGVILFDETIRQSASDGTPFPQLLAQKGIIPGIKVDIGAKPLAHAEGETVTEGLDGLRGRLKEYRDLGARFAKWRATYSITDELPSDYCIWVNAHALARYAALCQEAGLVPIVEPEVLQDGTHTIERSFHVTSRVLDSVYTELFDQRVDVFGTLLKPNMVLSGYDAPDRAGHDEIAHWSLECYYKHVPAAVPGIVFLSGGQSDEDATANLNAMNAKGPHPWQLSFSYGRALQAPAIKAWGGKDENVEAAQRAYYHRAKMNGAARTGSYAPEMEREAVPA
jgi:fructose-bisphosphate aldolase class I